MTISQNRRWLNWLSFSIIIALCDQLTKMAILSAFVYGEMRPITDFFNLVLITNRGAAFSFLATVGGWQRWVFITLGIVATVIIAGLLKRHDKQTLFCSALALILGGNLGNVIDRLRYGHVIDFLDFHLHGWHWPTFNLADSAIVCGAALLVLNELRRAGAQH
jgi:signal peptidase II